MLKLLLDHQLMSEPCGSLIINLVGNLTIFSVGNDQNVLFCLNRHMSVYSFLHTFFFPNFYYAMLLAPTCVAARELISQISCCKMRWTFRMIFFNGVWCLELHRLYLLCLGYVVEYIGKVYGLIIVLITVSSDSIVFQVLLWTSNLCSKFSYEYIISSIKHLKHCVK